MDPFRYNSSATLVTLSPGNTTNDVIVLVEDEAHVEFISREFVDGFADMLAVLMPVLCVLAVFFCVLNALVYWQQRGATFALYLIAVDLGDGFCSFLQLMFVITGFTLPADSYSHLIVKWYISKYVGVSFRRAAVCLNALASLERFLAIAFPLKSVTRRVCGKAVVIIIATFAISLAAHTYFILEYKVVANGRGGWMLSHTDVRKANPDVFALWSLTDVSIFAYSPLVAIMLLNSTLLVVLKRHAKSLKSVRRVRGTGRSSRSQADSALSRSDSVLSRTDSALSKTDSALSKTDSALSKTDSALSKTDSALSRTDSALSKTDSALSRTDSALSRTDSALSRTDSALSKTDSALSKTDSALSRTDSALSKTDSALSRTDSALSRTDSALSRTDSALSRTDSALSKTDSALSRTDSALSRTDSALSGQDDSGLVTVTTGMKGNKPGGKDRAEGDKMADRKKREEKKTRENQTTKMVMVFSTVFLAMALPRMLNSSASNLIADYGPQGKERNLYSSIGLLSDITSHLTETALFFVSFCYSRSFRRAVFRLPLARWLCGRWLAKPALAGTSSVDVSSATGRSGLSRSGSETR